VTIQEAKHASRERAKERRRAAREAAGSDAARIVADRFFRVIPLRAGAVVSGYWPLPDEFDSRPLLTRLSRAGHPLGLPVVVGRDEALVFRAWSPGTPLAEGGFGVSVPPEDAPKLAPELLIVPLLAFDREGYRLGYGGGCFDRTLATLRAGAPPRVGGKITAVGIAFSGQEVETVPHDSRDQRLEWILTEREAIALGGP